MLFFNRYIVETDVLFSASTVIAVVNLLLHIHNNNNADM